MDSLGPADITFGAGDIDGLGFPSADEHITTTGGHGLPAETLSTHTRHGQNELMFSSAQLDMSEYENSLTQNVAMGQLDPVMNTDVRALTMDNIQNRSTESDMGHLMRTRHTFSSDGSGSRAFTVNQLQGFQQIQQTQPLGSNHNMTNGVQQMYPPRNEQSYQTPTNFDVNAFLNTRQSQQQVVSSSCSLPQLPYISNNYVESSHLLNQQQTQNMHQQFLGQNIRHNVATITSSMPNRLPPTSGISAMLSGIKSENIDTSGSRRQRHSLPPISHALNGSSLNQQRIPSDIFGMVAEALPSLKLPPSAQHDGIPSTTDDLVSQGVPIDQRMVTSSRGPINSSLLPVQQSEQITPEVVYQENTTKGDDLQQMPQQKCHLSDDVRDGEDVSSATDEDDGTEDDKDEDYVSHLEDVTYKHKKLMKARQHKCIREQQIPSKHQKAEIKTDIHKHSHQQMRDATGDHAEELKEEIQITPKKNPIEGITLDVGPDGATRVKVNFVPGKTMAEELVAAFQTVLEKQLKHGQDGEAGTSQTTGNNQSTDPPSVLELSFKLTTPEKTKIPAGTVKEYDKPKRSWKERAHHEQEERADVVMMPTKTQYDDSGLPVNKDPSGPADEEKRTSESASKDKSENEDSQGNLSIDHARVDYLHDLQILHNSKTYFFVTLRNPSHHSKTTY